jgi:hypothetical protein
MVEKSCTKPEKVIYTTKFTQYKLEIWSPSKRKHSLINRSVPNNIMKLYLTLSVAAVLLIIKSIQANYTNRTGEIEHLDTSFACLMGGSGSTTSHFLIAMKRAHSRKQDRYCRRKQVLLYLCAVLLQKSYAPEPNPGPRQVKYPCGICTKAVKWTTPDMCCDNCDVWYHQQCMGMSDAVYLYIGLANASWCCFQCGLQNISSTIFNNSTASTQNLTVGHIIYEW